MAILSQPQYVLINPVYNAMRIAKGSTLNDIPDDTWRIDNIIINYVKTTLQRCIDITMKLSLPYVSTGMSQQILTDDLMMTIGQDGLYLIIAEGNHW